MNLKTLCKNKKDEKGIFSDDRGKSMMNEVHLIIFLQKTPG